MTLRTNARVAGVAFLLYIAAAFTGLMMLQKAGGGATDAAGKLASLARHAADVRLAVLLELVGCCCALVLAVTLWAITREEDSDLAMLILVFRAAEGAIGGVSLPHSLDRLWLATASGPAAPDPATAKTLAAFLYLPSGGSMVGASFFAVASTIFAYLLLRGRMVPAWLAWLGVIASLLIVVGCPLQLAGFAGGMFTQVMWLPMLAFEVIVALWFIVKGVARPGTARAAA